MSNVRQSMLKNLAVATRSIVDSAVTAAKIANGSISGAKVAEMATDGTSFAPPIELRIAIADGTANTDITVPFKCEIVDVHALKSVTNGGAGDTIQLKTGGGTAISDAMSLNISADGGIVRGASLEPTQRQLASGATLRFAATKVTDCSCVVVVKLHKRA